MQRLYLLRHGIAYPPGTPEFEEDERPLTPKGRRRMGEVARGLRRLGIAPDRIVSSPLPRARETAEIVGDRLKRGDRLEFDDVLRPGQSAGAIRAWLVDQGGDAVMIVGHDPAFSGLVSVLPGGEGSSPITELKKGGIACFTVEEPGRFRLDWLATPGLIRRIGR